MTATIKATGSLPGVHAPTITISSGRGNTDETEIHIQFRDDSDGQSTLLQAWFPADRLFDAIHGASIVSRDADTRGRSNISRLTEPAEDAA